MKVAILGAGGCFALNFANALHNAGIAHFGIGRAVPKPAPFWLAPPDYQYHVADLVDHHFVVMDILDRERPDIIVNFAAQGEGAASFGDHAPDFYRTNCWGLARIVDGLRRADYLRQFIQISTSELYGGSIGFKYEIHPLSPTSPYAISKAAFDQHLQVMHRICGFPATIVRPSNCYCPGQQLHRIIPKAIICARVGRKLPLEGGGMARKTYMHADDLSSALIHLLDRDACGEIFNVGDEFGLEIYRIVRCIAEMCRVQFDDLVEVVGDRVGQDACYEINSSKMRALGWRPSYTLSQGIQTVIDWIDEFPELLTAPTGYAHRR